MDERLAKGVVRKSLLLGSVFRYQMVVANPKAPLPGGNKVEKRYQLISSTIRLYELQDSQCIARNTTIIDVERLIPHVCRLL